MGRKLDGDISEWASDVVYELRKSGLSSINVCERILRDPGISTDHSKDIVLWWPRNATCAKIGRAMHQIDAISRVCLIVNSGHIMKSDGNSFNNKDLAKCSSLTVTDINRRIKKAKLKLAKVLERLERNIWRNN